MVLGLVNFEAAAVVVEARAKPFVTAVPAHAVAVIGALLAWLRAGPLRVNPGDRAGKRYTDETGHDVWERAAGLEGSSPLGLVTRRADNMRDILALRGVAIVLRA